MVNVKSVYRKKNFLQPHYVHGTNKWGSPQNVNEYGKEQTKYTRWLNLQRADSRENGKI